MTRKNFVSRLVSSGVMAAILLSAQIAQAHFVWLVPESADGQNIVHVYFGEDAAPDDPAFLKYTEGMQAWTVTNSSTAALGLDRTEETVSANVPAKDLQQTIVAARHDLGVMDRGDSRFRLNYYAKTGPALESTFWSDVDCSQVLRLDLVPERSQDGLRLHAYFDGEAVAGSEIVASGPGEFEFAGKTGESGTVNLSLKQPGLYSIRARHIEDKGGELEGKTYPETRHYTTLTLRVQSELSQAATRTLQPLEQPVTSFGGAIHQGNVYIYGGHTGSAHSYAKDEQGHTLKQLSLKTGEWKDLANGPHLQGLALVAHGKRLYRIGGFTAKNAEGEEHDLWSQDSVAAFDLETNDWIELPSLPEARSSFDAAVLGDTIYVIGGWKMAGDADSVWHETAWAMDLNAETPAWTEIPAPPFQRRALAVAAHDGKIFAIGGMQATGGPTTRVDLYDPQTKTWSEGASLVPQQQADDAENSRFSPGMTGFGVSAFAAGGNLYATTINGALQRLSADGSRWDVIAKTPTPRFFHRLLPVSDSELLVVGGASMEIGKFEEVEIIDLDRISNSQPQTN